MQLEQLRNARPSLTMARILAPSMPASVMMSCLALGTAEQGVQHRCDLAVAALLQEGDDVVVGHRRRAQHLVDLAVGEALAQHVQREPLELGLVAGSALLQLHQHRAGAIPGDAGQVEDQRLRLVGRDDRLHRVSQAEEGAVVTGQKRLASAKCHPRQRRPSLRAPARDRRMARTRAGGRRRRPRTASCSRSSEVLAEVVVEGMHRVQGSGFRVQGRRL